MSVLGIADTGFIYAYLDPDDEHHGWAVEQFQRFPSFITCEAVIAEAAYLTGSRLKRPTLVIEMLATGVLEIAYSLRGDEENVAALMEKYADLPMDLADACLVRMTEQHSSCEVLTVDGDFQVYRRHGREAIPTAHP